MSAATDTIENGRCLHQRIKLANRTLGTEWPVYAEGDEYAFCGACAACRAQSEATRLEREREDRERARAARSRR